jgi:hypothetical protein
MADNRGPFDLPRIDKSPQIIQMSVAIEGHVSRHHGLAATALVVIANPPADSQSVERGQQREVTCAGAAV